MVRDQVTMVLRKPSVRIKFLLVTLLFIPWLMEQVDILVPFADSYGRKGGVTVFVMLLHVFNYLYFYVEVLLVGFILLIPDIVRNEYTEKQSVLAGGSRKRAAFAALARIVFFSFLYVVWFVFLTVVISGVRIHNFSLEWPHFVDIVIKQVSPGDRFNMSLFMLPKGCTDYSVPVALALVLLRSTLGFIFLGLLASLVTMFTKKVKYGVGITVILLAVTLFLYYHFFGAYLEYYDGSRPITDVLVKVDLIKATLVPFFSFRSIGDDFTYWIRYGILAGLGLSVLTGAGIWVYYQKGDLGDADQDE